MPAITANGIEIAYEEFGDAKNPVMLLVQGLGMPLAAWMGEVCVAQLPKRVQTKLSERPGAHRPKKSEVSDG